VEAISDRENRWKGKLAKDPIKGRPEKEEMPDEGKEKVMND